MRYCQIYDQVQLGRMTLTHYYLMMKSVGLQLVDKQRALHMQAWLNVQAKATKQRGKKVVPYFKSFDDFFKDPLSEQTGNKKTARHEQMNDELKQMLLKANGG
ncbi:MAG: hypothetical protein FWG67_02590 [Defluviitaleaceae bacterium]|nr:hypothetical protein [Defluviitaleaceae bacterium]